MADKDLEKRLAALEDGLSKATAKGADLERENKRLKAQLQEVTTQARNHITSLNTMRDLSQSPDQEPPREKRARLMEATFKADGFAYYWSETPSLINGAYHQGSINHPNGDGLIVVKEDHEPSITWFPVKVGGEDPKTGAPILVPVYPDDRKAAAAPEDKKPKSIANVAPLTNTELNAQRDAQRRQLSETGPGAPRASDTQV